MGIACRRSLLLCLVVIDDCVDWGGIGSWLSEMSVDCDPAFRRDIILLLYIIFCVHVLDHPCGDPLFLMAVFGWPSYIS
jgi:hypothetical protein